ncbi:KGK domain-containing protein [Spirulina sp. CS-785/01]|uniref:KGK domain-containing protein n=1 Tax=Spirulina sp. CS-785/01 TaxID=3021716 RepID=UPI00232DEE06|nr:KGK domain-containing protein [Spirulina sp. CS-785/01]MDB9313418.1 KGK domain-containing protein [Spirulina sp. CS-785/01]
MSNQYRTVNSEAIIITRTHESAKDRNHNAYWFWQLESELSATYQADEVIEAMKNHIKHSVRNQKSAINFLEEGIDCKILTDDGKGWQKGKCRAKFSIEFYPDEEENQPSSRPNSNEPNSPLDDIRNSPNS